MYKPSKYLISTIFVLSLSQNAVANEVQTDWSFFSTWCPTSLSVCRQPTQTSEHELDFKDLVDVNNKGIEEVEKNDTLFSDLLPVYQALEVGAPNIDLTRYIVLLNTDLTERKLLYRYANGEHISSLTFSRKELKYYYKELMYLKSLQSINQKQILLLDTLSDSKASELRVQVLQQRQNLNEAMNIVAAKLKNDISDEEQLLRYFIYKRDQARE